MTARVNKVMLAAELVVLAIFLVIGIVALTQGKGRGFDFSPLYDSGTFSWSLVFGAVSIAVRPFLGFDGISTLAEENKESAEAIGRAMVAALLLAGVLFIVQTWVASLLVPDPAALVAKGDPGGTAFYDAAATLLVAVVSLVLGLYFNTRDDGISLLSTLVNFGALTAFLALHVSVVVYYVVRGGSRDWWRHLVAPVIGFAILAYVLLNAQLQAKWLGLIWFAVWLAVLVVLVALGRRPELALVEEESR